jgi:putative SOS response-associated peptidase YedK
MHVWPRPSLLRCQRDQTRRLDPVASADSEFPPSWNVAPTDQIPVVRFDRKAGECSLDLLGWGLVPYWAPDTKVGFANINAKAEGIETRPAFREAFQRRRCLVPVETFTNGQKPRSGSSPMRSRSRTGA